MPAHAPTVSRLLTKAGFTKSESWSTSVRGWHNRSDGFRAYKAYGENEGSVIVDHAFGSYGNKPEASRVMLEKYCRVLREAGYTVENDSGHFANQRLIVNKGE